MRNTPAGMTTISGPSPPELSGSRNVLPGMARGCTAPGDPGRSPTRVAAVAPEGAGDALAVDRPPAPAATMAVMTASPTSASASSTTLSTAVSKSVAEDSIMEMITDSPTPALVNRMMSALVRTPSAPNAHQATNAMTSAGPKVAPTACHGRNPPPCCVELSRFARCERSCCYRLPTRITFRRSRCATERMARWLQDRPAIESNEIQAVVVADVGMYGRFATPPDRRSPVGRSRWPRVPSRSDPNPSSASRLGPAHPMTTSHPVTGAILCPSPDRPFRQRSTHLMAGLRSGTSMWKCVTTARNSTPTRPCDCPGCRTTRSVRATPAP